MKYLIPDIIKWSVITAVVGTIGLYAVGILFAIIESLKYPIRHYNGNPLIYLWQQFYNDFKLEMEKIYEHGVFNIEIFPAIVFAFCLGAIIGMIVTMCRKTA